MPTDHVLAREPAPADPTTLLVAHLAEAAAGPVSEEAAGLLRRHAAFVAGAALRATPIDSLPDRDELGRVLQAWRDLGLEKEALGLVVAVDLASPGGSPSWRDRLTDVLSAPGLSRRDMLDCWWALCAGVVAPEGARSKDFPPGGLLSEIRRPGGLPSGGPPGGALSPTGAPFVNLRSLRFVNGMRTYDGEPLLGIWSDGRLHLVGRMVRTEQGPPYTYLYEMVVIPPCLVAAIVEGAVTVAAMLEASPEDSLRVFRCTTVGGVDEWTCASGDRGALPRPTSKIPGLFWADLVTA